MVAVQGTYTVWRWPPATAGASSLAWDLTVLRDPGPTTYFWAQQWRFEGGDVGYFGLQAHDRRDDGSVGKLAVFSVWSATGCADNPGCQQSVEGTPFWTCRRACEWVPGRTYRLRVTRTRPGWWSASVTDRVTGAQLLVGSIQVPQGWGGLDLAVHGSSMWTEFYAVNAPGGVAACDLVSHARARFGVPVADGDTVVSAGHANRLGDGDCANSRVADVEDGVVHEMGIPIRPLAVLLGDVRAATAYRYDATDSLGNRMDTAKVIASPAGGYLAVYHSGQVCHLASSTDLMDWTHRAVVDEPATQPTIAIAPDGGLVTAAEFNDGHGGRLRVRYWSSLQALLAGRPARQFLAARTLSACNEGTPSVRRIVFDPDADAATIELGFHYHRDCRVDRQARGTLTGFRQWTAAADPDLDAAVERAAAAAGERVGGNIGDRDHLRYMGRDYDLVEAQGREDDFGSWRVYLYDRSAGTARRLDIVTHRGSTAFANPTATCLRDPSGRNVVMVTLFLPVEGAAPGEAGSLLYYVPVDEPLLPT